MKVYNLSCEQGHQFEGWFASEEDSKKQLLDERIECPFCESSKVQKLPSAPRLNLSVSPASSQPEIKEAQGKYLDIMRHILSNTEDMGDRFVEEVRRIHYREAPERGIRGTATLEQCKALAEEGVEVMSLPVPAALKYPVQ